MSSRLVLRLLGAADLRHPDGASAHSVLAQPKRFALLCYLAEAAPGEEFHRREQLLALLWPEAEPGNARAALRNALYFLRRSLGADVVQARGADEVRLAPGCVRSDVAAFREALDAGRLEEALDAYAGPLLPAFAVDDAPGWNEWLDGRRALLARRAGEAAETLAARAQASGDPAGAVRWSRRAVELRPDEEEPVRRLMTRLAAAGDRAAARAVYAELEARTRAAFGEPPSAATRRVLQSLREAEADAAPAGAVQASPPPPAPPAAPPSAARARPRRASRRLLAAAAAAVVLGAAAGVRGGGAHEPPAMPVAAEWDRVAVLPFQVRGYTRHAYLGPGMVDLLSATLDGAGRLRTADPRAVLAAVPYSEREISPAAAREAAARLGARYVVLGSVVASAERLRVSASLYDRRGGEPVAVASAEGRVDEVFAVVDALGMGLLADRLRGPRERLDGVALRTTASLPALKLYLRGVEELRAGRFQAAIDLMQQSIAADGGFALAAYRLAVAADGAGARPDLVDAALDRALRNAHRLPERERLFLQAYAAGDAAAFRGLLERYPDSPEGWYHLADLDFHALPGRGMPFTGARHAFERVLAQDPLHSGAILHLARIEAREGNHAAVDSLTRRALDRWPEGEEALELWALRALALDDTAALRRARGALLQAGDNRGWITAWRAVLYTGGPARADTLLQPLTAASRPRGVRAAGWVARAQLALARGRPARARAHLAAAERLDPQIAARFRTAAAAYPLGGAECGGPRTIAPLPDSLAPLPIPTLDAARRGPGGGGRLAGAALGALEAACRGNAAGARAAAGRIARGGDSTTAAVVRAHLALAAGGRWRAERLASFRAPGLPEAHARWLAAEFARRDGRHAEAYRLYASIPVDLEYANLPYHAPAELRMAEMAERLGRPGDAARHYRRFVRAWQDAEPALRPLVEHARRRAETLRGR